MADIEREKNKKKGKKAKKTKLQETAEAAVDGGLDLGGAESEANVKSLAASAGAALGFLDEEAGGDDDMPAEKVLYVEGKEEIVAEIVDVNDATSEEAQESIDAAEGLEAEALTEASEEDEAQSIEWQMATAELLEPHLEGAQEVEPGDEEENVTANMSAEERAEYERLGGEFAEGASAEAAGENPEVQFVENDQLLSVIESLLFSSDKPTSVATIKQAFKGTNIRSKDIHRALEELASEYASARRGVAIEEINGGYQLRTKVDNADFLRKLGKARPFKLSGPALEVLSIMAYKQPITKTEVDQIRGVESGHLVRALMERGLVNFQGKSDLPGKPMTYGTTRKFLEIFGLRNLKELPTLGEIEELIPDGIGDVEDEKDETLSDITSKMSEQALDTYSVGEEELGDIVGQLQAIDTTSAFFEQEKIRQREVRDRNRAQDIREAMTVGENVDEKDVKWLKRYDAKIAAAEAAATAAASGQVAADGAMEQGSSTVEAQGVEGEFAVVDKNGNLVGSDELLADGADSLEFADENDEVVLEGHAQEFALDDESGEVAFTDDDDDEDGTPDDLEANPDWDDEKEA